MNNKGFIAFYEWLDNIEVLTDEQAGRLFRAVFAYANTGEEAAIDDPVVGMAFRFIRQDIDRTQEKYEDISRKRSEARKNKLQQTTTKDNKRQQTETKPTSSTRTSTRTSTSTRTKQDTPPTPSRVGEEPFGIFKNVFLKPAEHRQLEMNYGKEQAADAIEDLSCKLADGTSESVYHYATLNQWLSYRRKNGHSMPVQPKMASDMSDEERVKTLKEQWEATGEDERRQYLERYGCKPWEREDKK